ncbi:hypothetical protein Poly24_07410 [Rosistilla carotiformis]|uniref:Uncharacterized protein n=1 Tax=Rosistilla carotiformis TaxID=2528017 RepID=A0A518JNC0_9BACT|nr:hypothetical protein Poly24_07410 [Rosistilla carotiformis]
MKRCVFTRSAEPGGLENERSATFFGEGLPAVSNISDCRATPLPEHCFARSTLPYRLRLGAGEAMRLHPPGGAGRVGKRAFSDVFRGGLPAVSNISDCRATPLPDLCFARSTLPANCVWGRVKQRVFTRSAEPGGSENERSAMFFGEGLPAGSNISDRRETALPERRFARSTLPIQTAFGGRVKQRDFTRPAEPGGSENERSATFFGEGLPAGSNINDRRATPSPRTLLRSFDPPHPNCVWGRVRQRAFTRSAEPGGLKNQAFSRQRDTPSRSSGN